MSAYFPYLAIAIILGCFFTLLVFKKEPEIVFGGGLLLMLASGIITPEVAFSGFANSGFITLACLFVLAAGFKESGLIEPVVQKFTGQSRHPKLAQIRITFPVAFLSAFLNNTPIVAAMIPGISKWSNNQKAKGLQWHKRYFLLPLSYAAILGGTCTIIGTSTNVLVYGFLQSAGYGDEISFFSIGVIGLPLTLVGLVYIGLFTWKIIKAPESQVDPLENTREYTVEMLLTAESKLAGKTVEEAHLRHLQGLYLIEIIRGHLIIPVIGPHTLLAAGDRLVFTGVIDSISELLSLDGLIPAEDHQFKLGSDSGKGNLVEAVVGLNHPLVGQSIKNGKFRKRYNASVIAVVRQGKRLGGKIGDIVIRPGDTLLLLARRSFIEQFRYSRDFMLVSSHHEFSVSDNQQKLKAGLIAGLFVILAATGLTSIVVAAILSALLMVVSGCLSLSRAKKSVDLQVLLTIAAAFGLGAGLTESGGAQIIANTIVQFSGNSPFALLVATYLMTMLLTEMVTNNAAAVIAYSLISGLVVTLGYNLVPYAIAIMIAASASFISPLGYQTNLMVYGAGRYSFADYLKLGIPLSLLAALVTLGLIPLVWDLQ